MVGPNKQASIDRVRNAVTLVWGLLRLAPTRNKFAAFTSVHFFYRLQLWCPEIPLGFSSQQQHWKREEKLDLEQGTVEWSSACLEEQFLHGDRDCDVAIDVFICM